MPEKRLLMIADADSFWTVRYIRYLLLPSGFQVTLFPIWGDSGTNTDFYRDNGIAVYHDPHTLPVVRRIPRARLWARVALNARDLKRLGPFDIVHNHYLSQRDLALGKRLARAFHARWACSFWGSDLLRAPAAELRRMAPYLRACDAVSVHNENSRARVRELYGEDVARKTTLLFFGQMGYGDIDDTLARFTRAQCRAHFGIAEDRFVVCVGYSASSAQQQLQAITAMAALPKERLERMTLVLQQTYGENDPTYTAQTREMAARLPCQTVVLTRFMGPQESAWLRLAADVFVHSITTDAFSASMQEYLYAGACVIKGDWLQYPNLQALGIELNSMAGFDDLPGLLARAMDGEIRGLTREQRALLPKLYSWEAVRGSWFSLYGAAAE